MKYTNRRPGILIAAAILSLLFAGSALATHVIPPLPHTFWGMVTINGSPTPVGTSVEARGPNVLTGVQGNPFITVKAGEYGSESAPGHGFEPKMFVQGDIDYGAMLTFYVNGVSTGQTHFYASGADTRLDLAVNIPIPLTFSLGKGWNIFSTPISLDESCNTWGKLVELGDGLDLDPQAATYYFDSLTQQWRQVLSDYQLKPCEAIYVKMAGPDSVTLVPCQTPSTPTLILSAGWNLVSLAYFQPMAVRNAVASAGLGHRGLTGYAQVISPGINQAGWTFVRVDAGNPNMEPAKGYWLFMVNPGELTGFSFTP